jgi:endonuclease-8
MPEGPQMVFIKEQLEQFKGQLLIEAAGKAKDMPFETMKGQVLTDIKTFGKELFFCFPEYTIRIHLLLFGKYAIDEELNRQLHLGLKFENGEANFYACSCKFITVPLSNMYDWSTDVMNEAFDREQAFLKLSAKPEKLICEALLDQDILAGVGNKIKNEVLFKRQIHPESVVGKIPAEVLKKMIDDCVTLSFDYLSWRREGIENEHWQVYKKKECCRDHIPLQIVKIGHSQRSCYFCDRCQHLYVAENL